MSGSDRRETEIAELRAKIADLESAEEGAKEAFGVVVREKHDALAECARLRELLTSAHAQIRKMAAAQPVAAPTPRGFLLHWPAAGGHRRLIWDDSRAAGDAIGCPVEPVYSLGVAPKGGA